MTYYTVNNSPFELFVEAPQNKLLAEQYAVVESERDAQQGDKDIVLYALLTLVVVLSLLTVTYCVHRYYQSRENYIHDMKEREEPTMQMFTKNNALQTRIAVEFTDRGAVADGRFSAS